LLDLLLQLFKLLVFLCLGLSNRLTVSVNFLHLSLHVFELLEQHSLHTILHRDNQVCLFLFILQKLVYFVLTKFAFTIKAFLLALFQPSPQLLKLFRIVTFSSLKRLLRIFNATGELVFLTL